MPSNSWGGVSISRKINIGILMTLDSTGCGEANAGQVRVTHDMVFC